MKTKEIWKPIAGWKSYYKISNFGRVKSIARTIKYKRLDKWVYRHLNEKILNSHRGINKYPIVCLCSTTSRRFYLVHRLVATAFIPNPKNKPTVNHKDGVKSNCHITNLEWVTGKENAIHAGQTGLLRYGNTHHLTKLTSLDIQQIRHLLTQNNSQQEIAKQFNVHQVQISKIKRGLIYKWAK